MRRPVMVEPHTLAEALQALRRPGAMPLAGATDIIPMFRRGERRPRLLVNLKRVPGLAGVRSVRGGVRVGALTSVADLLGSESLPALLLEAARGFGSPQIRTMATIGGNLCNATPSADLALSLLALDARLQIRGEDGPRGLDIGDFFRGPNRTALRRGEVLTAILIPKPGPRAGVGYAKLCGRRAMDLPLVGIAALLQMRADGATCARARIALGAVAPIPMRARKAEALLEGQRLTPELITKAAALAAREARPVTDLRASAKYRRDMVQALSARTLQQAFTEASKGARR